MTGKQAWKWDCLSDRQLVDLLLANDEQAVEYVFFHRCDALFSHVIGNLFQSQVKKEELVTEFYLFLRDDDWRRLLQFAFRSSLDTWLAVVAVRFFNAKRQILQTKKAETDAPIEKAVWQIPDSYDPYDEMSKLELYEAIERLPKPRERMALLGELAGKRAEEVAEELGCTVTAVYNLTKKARMTLKKRMKGKER